MLSPVLPSEFYVPYVFGYSFLNVMETYLSTTFKILYHSQGLPCYLFVRSLVFVTMCLMAILFSLLRSGWEIGQGK
jgi:hypothetical protein